ncbi:MAG: hypothetical protein ACE5ID_08810, partial [Acidobacteriota bacterium]
STQFVGGNILFVTAKVTDLNGDMDGLPDANERVHLDLSLVSNMLDSADNPVVLENTRIFLSSTDPDVACILDNVAAFGDLTPGVVATNPAGDGFEFVVAPVNRLATSQLIRATFTLGISGTFVDIAGRQRTVSSFATPQRFSLNLDLDLPVAVTPVPDFTENWDSVQAGGDGLNSFTSGPVFPTNDASTVDGSRCQYHDPDGPNPEGGGRDPSICRPWPGSDWHVMTPANAPVAKAFSGDGALLMGTHEVGQDASFDSYTSGQLSFAMSPVLNIGVSGGSTLSFRHIVALADDRLFSIPAGEAADRAVVQVAQADPFSGSIASAWETIPAFQNNYTNQGTDSFINCQFDPVDDFYDTFSAVPGADLFLPQNIDGVSTEDDYFDPNDPERRLGPSSTCFPQFVFAFMGDWTSNDPAKSGNAFVLGSTGSRGGGIWVESRFNLDAYAGESIRVRLLFSGLELGGPTGARWVNLFGNQLGNATRGWVVDDFRVSGLVNIPTPLSTDSKPPPPPVCPVDPDPTTPANEAACGTAVADAGPDQVSPAPGFLVSLDGSASSLDACVDGFIEYRWRLNGRTVQDWSNESRFRDNPVFSSVYELDVRCSVDPACSAVKSITVTMGGKLAEVSQGSGAAEFQVGHAPPRILTGADGIAQTQVLPGSDDIQVTPQGLTGTVAVSAGPDGILQTMVPAGDDVLADYGARLDWNGVGPGFGYDIQRIDIDAFDPVPLREDPLAAPPGSLPVSRMCRLAQTGEAVLSFVEETLAPSPGQVIGYLINSRRLVDGVPGQLGAGLTPGGLRLSRPGAVSTSCP